MPQGAPRTSIARSLSPDSSLSSALSLESVNGAYGVSAHPVKNMTTAAAEEDVKLRPRNSRRQSQKRGAAEHLGEVSATKKRKTAKVTVVEESPLDEETATPVVERVRRSRKTTEPPTKVSNNAGKASNKTKTRDEKENVVVKQETSPKRTKRTTKIKVETTEIEEEEVATPKKSRKRTKKKTPEVEQEAEEAGEGGKDQPKKKRRRKTKEEKEAEAMPLAARTTGLRMFLGAHVSSAKGGLQPISIPGRFNHVYSVRVGLKSMFRSAQCSHQLRAHRVTPNDHPTQRHPH